MSADSLIPPGSVSCSGGNLAPHIFVVIILILLNGFFAMSSAAVIALSDSKLKKAAVSSKRAAILVHISDKPSFFLLTLRICFGITSVFAGAYTAVYICGGIDCPQPFLSVLSVLIMLLVVLAGILFGELIPKRLGECSAEGIALFSAYPLAFIYYLLYIPARFLNFVSNILIRIFGIDPSSANDVVTEEEIRLMVDAGEEKGVIPETERTMINNIFDFNDTTVSKIMTHRTDIVAIPKNSSFEDIVSTAAAEGYTRLPVYEGTLDNIIGILHTKSLISHLSKSGVKFRIDYYLIKPYFVPKSKLADSLFDEMQKKKLHIAVVVDEYGGTAGIVTLEDLIESILGNIQDEYDDEENETRVVDDHTFLVDGSASLDDVFDMASLEIPDALHDDFEYDTIGGFCTSMIDKIPENGDSFTFENAVFEIADADDKKINMVKVTVNKRQ